MSFQKLFSNQLIQAIIFLLFLLFVWKLRSILVILFIAFIIASSIYPISSRLEQKIPKSLAVGIPYLFVVAVLLLIIFSFVPVITTQTKDFIIHFPTYLGNITKLIHLQINTGNLQSFFLERVTALSNNAYSITVTVFEELLTFFITIFISIYFLADRSKIHLTASQFLPGNKEKNKLIFEDIEQTLGAWARGQIILSGTIFLADFIAYLLIGIPFALPLALLAGLLEIIPTVGPIVAAIPAIIVALTISPSKAFLVLGIYILIQIVEGNFLVPKIMQHVIGLHPIVIMVAILAGSELMGIAGALISIPFVSLITMIWQKTHT